MDKFAISEGVQLSCASAADQPWTEFFEKNPAIDGLFKAGIAQPLFLDLMFADKEFTPFHDDPNLNGKKYRIKKKCIEKAVKDQAFTGRPVFLHDLNSADHAQGERRVIGNIHGAVMKEDERGAYPQVLAAIWDKEIPEEFLEIQENKEKIGASAEFFVKSAKKLKKVTDITEFMPHGAILMDKSNAAFKETALYCSDPTEAGEADDGQNTDKKTDCENKTKEGGNKLSKFCETCTPLVGTHTSEAAQALMDKFIKDLKTYAENDKTVEGLRLAASDATKKTEDVIKEFDDFKADKEAKEKTDLENLNQMIAAGDANKQFEKRKGDYPEDKHDEVHRILLKIRLNQVTPEEVFQLADWKTASMSDEGGDQLRVTGGSGDDDGKKLTDKQLDALLALEGVPGVPVTKGGSK